MTKKEFFEKYKNERDYEDFNPINSKCIICDCDINTLRGSGVGKSGLTFMPIKPNTFDNKDNGVINLEYFTICEKCFFNNEPLKCDNCDCEIDKESVLCFDCLERSNNEK